MSEFRGSLPDRFVSKVSVSAQRERDGVPCVEWVAARNNAGYGVFHWDGRLQLAHRVAYELLVGPIPGGLTIDHLCRNRACVCVAHLEPVTHGENMRRGRAIEATLERHAKRTHCAAGHELVGINVRRPRSHPTWRVCRVCEHDYYLARRTAANG